MASPRDKPGGDLSVTALYTSGAYAWAGLPGADLLANPDSSRVFGATNAALAVARVFMPEIASLRHAIVHRHAMIDHLLAASGAQQVLELAAGLSRRGVTASADASLRYTEVDLARVIEHKRALLERTDAGRAALARPNLRLVAADATTAPLDPLIEPGERLLVIAEGLCMYLDADAQRSLWRRVRALFERAGGGAFVFDLVPACEQPRPGAIGRALEWTMKRFTGGKSFARDARTRDDIAADLREAGFADVETFEPGAVAEAWGLPFPEVPTQQLLFVCRS